MDGLNKLFMRDVRTFLTKRVIQHAKSIDGASCPKDGLYDFDFHEEGGITYLRRFSDRPKKMFEGSANRIPAQWVGWTPNKTHTITLKDTDHYLFTATLSGCRIRISGDRSAPTFSHIAYGLHTLSRPDFAKTFRQKQTAKLKQQEIAKQAKPELTRTLSSSAIVDKEHETMESDCYLPGMNVVGAKGDDGLWRFFVQIPAVFDNGNTAIHKVWELYKGSNDIAEYESVGSSEESSSAISL